MNSISTLLNRATSYESTTLEFKSAKGGFPRSFWETYSSFANTQGGVIYLGVKEKNHEFIIDGLSSMQIKAYEKELWDGLNNRNKVSANILRDDDVKEIPFEDSFILEITVPRAALSQRPIYLNGVPVGNTYKRYDEGDYVCTEEEVGRMYAEAHLSESPQDSRILSGFSFEEDIDISSFSEYRKLFSTMHPTHPWASLPDLAFLSKLGGYRKDRRTKEEGITLSGMLMFGKFSSITDVDCCPQYFPDYREYDGSKENDRWSDRVYYDGTWEANLFQFYRRVYNKLAASLPKPFALKDGRRVEDSPMHVALREAFVNCLIHCDYSVGSNIIIESYRNKYVFTNPGNLLIPLSQYYRGGESKCRNTSLQQMFMQIGNAEKAGSGVDKIIEGWKSANYRYPAIEERTNKVVLTLPLESILSDEVLNSLKGIYGENIASIDHEKLLVLAACASDGYTSNYRIQFVLEKHPSDITLLLKNLCQEGYLVSSGIGKGTRYTLNEHYLLDKTSTNRSILFGKDASFGMDFSSEFAGGSRFLNVNSSTANMDSSITNVDSSMTNVDSSMTNVDSNEIATKPKRAKTSIDQLQKMILAVCREDYKSIEEIAKGVGKTIKYLKNGIIARMVTDGLLERKHPTVPTHPNQKYKTRPLDKNGDPTLF